MKKVDRRVRDRLGGPERRCRITLKWSIGKLHNDLNIVEDIKIRRLGWAGHIIRMEEERIPKKGFKWNLPQHKTSGKTKNQMGRRGSEGCITAVRSKRMEEKS